MTFAHSFRVLQRYFGDPRGPSVGLLVSLRGPLGVNRRASMVLRGSIGVLRGFIVVMSRNNSVLSIGTFISYSLFSWIVIYKNF